MATTIFLDAFDEAADTNLASHQADVGATPSWTEVEDTVGTTLRTESTGDYMRPTAGGASARILYVAHPNPALSGPDLDLIWTFRAIPSGMNDDPFFAFARYLDNNNYYFAGCKGDQGVFFIGKRVSGTSSLLVTTTANGVLTAGDVMRFELRGTTLRLFRNGSQILTTTDGDLTAAGAFGWGFGNAVGLATDDIQVAWQIDDCEAVDQNDASGTVYEIDLGGSITPAGAVTRAIATRLAGAVSPASALVHVIAQALASTLTSAGALRKATSRSSAGAIAPDGATSAATNKSLAGELEPSGTVEQIKLIAQALEGSIEPAGVLTRDTSKALTGSLTPEGDLAQATDKRLAGSVATSGTLARQVARPVEGEVTPAGEVTATRVIVRAFSGALSLAGALVRSALTRTGGSVAPAGDLAPAPSKQVGGAITPTGQVRRAITRRMAGSVSMTASLALALVQAAPLNLRRAVTRYVGPITRTASRIGQRLATVLKPGTRRTKGH